MNKKVGNSLKDVLRSLINVSGQLFRKHLIIYLTAVIILGGCFWAFTKSPHQMTFVLCVLISLVSIILYVKTDNYAETLLSFMLGVLTIFTVNWDNYTSKLFILFYIGLNTLLFFISSIRMASKLETILTNAATYIDLENFSTVYNKLNAICSRNTKYNNLSIIEKGEIVKYLAYMKIQTTEMPNSILDIELIKVCYQLDLKTSCDFFKIIYFIKYRTHSEWDLNTFISTILNRRLPIDPLDFIKILEQTKSCLISKKLSLTEYLDKIEKLAFDGYSDENIVATLNS